MAHPTYVSPSPSFHAGHKAAVLRYFTDIFRSENWVLNRTYDDMIWNFGTCVMCPRFRFYCEFSGSAFENIICTITCVVLRGSAIQCRELKKIPPGSSRSQDRNCRSIIPEFTYYIHVWCPLNTYLELARLLTNMHNYMSSFSNC